MPTFRKKPVVIKAYQFDINKLNVVCDPDIITRYPGDMPDWTPRDCRFFIETLEGAMEVRQGDWVVTGISGEKYPCKDQIFRASYDLVIGTDEHGSILVVENWLTTD